MFNVSAHDFGVIHAGVGNHADSRARHRMLGDPLQFRRERHAFEHHSPRAEATGKQQRAELFADVGFAVALHRTFGSIGQQ